MVLVIDTAGASNLGGSVLVMFHYQLPPLLQNMLHCMRLQSDVFSSKSGADGLIVPLAPVTFAFDCLAAGHAAQGTWLCTRHAELHRRTRALQHWLTSRYCCHPDFLHIHSHRGDPWNEAADAVC